MKTNFGDVEWAVGVGGMDFCVSVIRHAAQPVSDPAPCHGGPSSIYLIWLLKAITIQNQHKNKNKKHTTAGILAWSPTAILASRSEA